MAASPYDIRARRFDSVQRLFVAKDSPEVRAGVPPESVTVDLASVDVKQLRERVKAKQARYETAPFDVQGELLRFYPGGVTVWSGFPGAGKTTLLRQLVCQLLQRGRAVFLASLEEEPDDILWRLMCTAAGTADPSDHQAQWFIDAYGERLRIWNMLGNSRSDDLLAAVSALKSEHAVIDSLMALDVSGYDWETQRLFARRLVGAARISGCHIHLVAHPKKPIAADTRPDTNDVAGTADLGRLVDNVIFIRRRADETPQANSTGMRVMLTKQRYYIGACPSYEGWFHRDFLQFHTDQFPSGPTRYLPPDAYT